MVPVDDANLAPLPLALPGCRNLWRLADLDRWLDKQKPARGLRRLTAPERAAAAETAPAAEPN